MGFWRQTLPRAVSPAAPHGLAQRLELDVAIPYRVTVVLQRDVAWARHRIVGVLEFVGCAVRVASRLCPATEVYLVHLLAVQVDHDEVVLADDVVAVPLACGLDGVFAGRLDVVNRAAVVLAGLLLP